MNDQPLQMKSIKRLVITSTDSQEVVSWLESDTIDIVKLFHLVNVPNPYYVVVRIFKATTAPESLPASWDVLAIPQHRFRPILEHTCHYSNREIAELQNSIRTVAYKALERELAGMHIPIKQAFDDALTTFALLRSLFSQLKHQTTDKISHRNGLLAILPASWPTESWGELPLPEKVRLPFSYTFYVPTERIRVVIAGHGMQWEEWLTYAPPELEDHPQLTFAQLQMAREALGVAPYTTTDRVLGGWRIR